MLSRPISVSGPESEEDDDAGAAPQPNVSPAIRGRRGFSAARGWGWRPRGARTTTRTGRGRGGWTRYLRVGPNKLAIENPCLSNNYEVMETLEKKGKKSRQGGQVREEEEGLAAAGPSADREYNVSWREVRHWIHENIIQPGCDFGVKLVVLLAIANLLAHFLPGPVTVGAARLDNLQPVFDLSARFIESRQAEPDADLLRMGQLRRRNGQENTEQEGEDFWSILDEQNPADVETIPLASTTTRPPIAAVSTNDRKLRAYDCSEPHDVHTVSLLQDTDIRTCEERELKAKQREESFMLVQKAEKVEFEVQECVVTASRLAYVCGSASHSAMANRESFFGHHWEQKIEWCQGIWDTGTFTLHKFAGGADTRKVELEHTNYLAYTRTGSTKNVGNDVACVGGKLPPWEMMSMKFDHGNKSINKSMTDMIVTDYLTVSVKTRRAYAVLDANGKPMEVMIPHYSGQLPCKYSEKGCITEYGTFIWKTKPQKDLCPYFKLRQVRGVLLPSTDEDKNQDVFLSDRDSMIRVTRNLQPLALCDTVLYATEFPQLFLTQDINNTILNRPIHPSEVSAFLHATVADSYIYHRTQKNLAEAVLGLQQHQCKQERQRSLTAYAARLAKQKAVSDGDTAHLGHGLYMTSSGEVAYLYWCRALNVTAKPFPGRCYNALPIDLEKEDEEHLRKILAGEGENPEDVKIPEMFLEPRSRRITTVASPMVCAPQFAPLYRNVHNDWIKLTHMGLHTAAEPKNPADDLDNSFFEPKTSDLPAPGKMSIYEYGTIRAGLIFLAMPNLVVLGRPDHVVNDQHRPDMSAFDDKNYFPDFQMEVPRVPSLWEMIGFHGLFKFWQFYHKYSTACTVIVGTIFLYQIICYLLGVFLALLCSPREHSMCWHVFDALFPTLATALSRGVIDPKKRRGPFYRPVLACLRMMRRNSSLKDRRNPRSSEESNLSDGELECLRKLEKFERKRKRIYPDLERGSNEELCQTMPHTTIRHHRGGVHFGAYQNDETFRSTESTTLGPNVRLGPAHALVSGGIAPIGTACQTTKSSLAATRGPTSARSTIELARPAPSAPTAAPTTSAASFPVTATVKEMASKIDKN